MQRTGASNAIKEYRFYDGNLPSGNVACRLKQIDRVGRIEYSQEVTVASTVFSFSLEQNHPNPFNPTTVISYQLPVNSRVTLKIYDVLEREVTTLVNEGKGAGIHSTVWDATSCAGGVYFYRLKAGSFSETKKLVLLR